MMQLEFGGRRYDIPAGDLSIGTDAASGLVLAGSGIQSSHAKLRATSEGSAIVIPGADNAVTLVNGVRLGAEPAPVLHGDRIQIGDHELLVVDNRKSGSTQFLDASAIAAMASAPSPAKSSGGPAPVTGGRLVCLTDGREYTVGSSLVFGREAGSGVVVENSQVSRRHAEITSTPQGYVLTDLSTNGTFVNGQRIEGKRTLARADMIRIGDSEYRFYADAAPAGQPQVAAPPPPPPAPPPTPMPSAPAEPSTPEKPLMGVPLSTPMVSGPIVPPPAGAAHRLNDTMHGQSLRPFAPPVATTSPAPERPSTGTSAMASFLVRSGKLKGTRIPVRVPVVNIGRAEYNDVVLADDSVSTAHAKLQRREGVWVLTDLGSTNGTFVDGEAVSGEVPIGPGVTVRFGQVSTMFEPTDDALGVAKGSGTRMMEPMKAPEPPPPPPAAAAPAAAAPPRPAPPREPAPRPTPPAAARRPPVVVSSSAPKSGGSKWLLPTILIVALAALAYYLLTR
jgi:pSer/pThr/pTyr-binding forkhead associated (FHA) protein